MGAKKPVAEQSAVFERWTERLGRSWTPVSDVFLNHYRELDITTAQAMFIIHLMQFKWGKDAPYPGFKTIALKMGVSVTAVRGYARELQKKKLIHREIRVDDTNIFHLEPLFRALDPFVEIDAELLKKRMLAKARREEIQSMSV